MTITTSDGARVQLDNGFQNTGHEFGAKLSDEEGEDLLEFLKTL